MNDTPESLLRELVEFRDPPLVAMGLRGPHFCWFCGVEAPDEKVERHDPECIWERARLLFAGPAGKA